MLADIDRQYRPRSAADLAGQAESVPAVDRVGQVAEALDDPVWLAVAEWS